MNLYILEMKKIRFSTYLWAILGIFASLLALGILFLFIFQIEKGQSGIPEEVELFANWNGLLALTTALAFVCFSVLSAVIAAKVVVSEYCGRNAIVLLSYPVKRKALLETKCLLVCGITTISAFISNIFVVGIMYVISHIFGIVPQMNTRHFVLTALISSILMGISSSAVGIISTAVGWKKRSGIATIVCSLIIVCVLTNFITVSPRNIIWVMLAISTVFFVIAIVIYHILANRIEKMEV
ncbi:MAG: ABC transporter permease subunit [Lachnospiraceae bacterium]|nr:ABC transporter permease subunit [Lachnospiraceae bacterium]MBD5483433.1 ABC transporter permease subunit [Lachnospiraceae bacterium]